MASSIIGPVGKNFPTGPFGSFMSLLLSKVPRSLETKTRLFGFELGDLLLIFVYLTLSNLVFGTTRLKFPIVWMGTLSIGGAIYFLKKGKPEKYLEHINEYLKSPTVFSAGAPDIQYRPYIPLKPLSKESDTYEHSTTEKS